MIPAIGYSHLYLIVPHDTSEFIVEHLLILGIKGSQKFICILTIQVDSFLVDFTLIVPYGRFTPGKIYIQVLKQAISGYRLLSKFHFLILDRFRYRPFLPLYLFLYPFQIYI